MFFPGSRYQNLPTYTVTTPTGATVTATTLPLPSTPEVRGFHRRLQGQRLDLLANFYLADPTTFWRLCDTSGTISPDALAVRGLVGVPFAKG
jgi:hypothetical protein